MSVLEIPSVVATVLLVQVGFLLGWGPGFFDILVSPDELRPRRGYVLAGTLDLVVAALGVRCFRVSAGGVILYQDSC